MLDTGYAGVNKSRSLSLRTAHLTEGGRNTTYTINTVLAYELRWENSEGSDD